MLTQGSINLELPVQARVNRLATFAG